MKNNHLVIGRHYIQQGRTIRFPWGQELKNLLLEDWASSQSARFRKKNVNAEGPIKPSIEKPRLKTNQRIKVKFNH